MVAKGVLTYKDDFNSKIVIKTKSTNEKACLKVKVLYLFFLHVLMCPHIKFWHCAIYIIFQCSAQAEFSVNEEGIYIVFLFIHRCHTALILL